MMGFDSPMLENNSDEEENFDVVQLATETTISANQAQPGFGLEGNNLENTIGTSFQNSCKASQSHEHFTEIAGGLRKGISVDQNSTSGARMAMLMDPQSGGTPSGSRRVQPYTPEGSGTGRETIITTTDYIATESDKMV